MFGFLGLLSRLLFAIPVAAATVAATTSAASTIKLRKELGNWETGEESHWLHCVLVISFIAFVLALVSFSPRGGYSPVRSRRINYLLTKWKLWQSWDSLASWWHASMLIARPQQDLNERQYCMRSMQILLNLQGIS